MSNSVFAQINCDDYKKTSSEYNTCKLKLFMSKSKKKLNFYLNILYMIIIY